MIETTAILDQMERAEMLRKRENYIATYNIYKGIAVVFLLLAFLFLAGLKLVSSDRVDYVSVFIPLYIYMSIMVLEGIGSGIWGAISDHRIIIGTFAGVFAIIISIIILVIGIKRIEQHARPDETEWSDLLIAATVAFFLYLLKVILYGFYNCQKVHAESDPLQEGAITL